MDADVRTAPGDRGNSLRDAIRDLQREIRSAARAEILAQTDEYLVDAPVQGHGDVSYHLDLRVEEVVDRFFRSRWRGAPITVICEGLGTRTYPDGALETEAEHRVLIDPLDGTRELMYDKRSAWILTGIAPNRGPGTSLADVAYALQTEVPPSKQNVGSVLEATRGGGAVHELWDLEGEPRSRGRRPLRPSRASELWNGYAVFVDFFAPGPRLATARLAEAVLGEFVPSEGENLALVFSDQYISNAGQIYLLAGGVYRFIADLRPVLQPVSKDGSRRGICSHPYDLSTALIAEEAGAIVTDHRGGPLAYPLDTTTDCAWVGYANQAIRSLLERPLQKALVSLGSSPA